MLIGQEVLCPTVPRAFRAGRMQVDQLVGQAISGRT
jgi:hypothetical protein